MKERNIQVSSPLTPSKAHLLNLDDLCHYQILQSQYLDQAIKLITQSFCTFEPMTRYLNIPHHEFIPFATQMVEKAIRDGLSIGAVVGHKLVACTIVEDVANPLTITFDIDPRFRFIFALLEAIGNPFFQGKVFEKNHLAHLFVTAVDPNYQGEGLSRKVNLESIKLAKAKNFDFMCCEFTHPYNEKGTIRNIHTMKKLIGSCVYKHFVFEGEKPFENLDGTASAYIWELKEGVMLNYQFQDKLHRHALSALLP